MEDIRPPSPTPAGPSPAPVKPSSSAPHRSTKSVISIVIIFVVLAAFALWLTTLNTETITRDENGNIVRTAPEGELVRNFPQGLLLEEGAPIDLSYSISYGGEETTLPFARYTSNKSYSENISEFRRTLKSEGWVILQDADDKVLPTTNIYAQKEGTDVNVIFTQKENEVEIQIAYSAKKN